MDYFPFHGVVRAVFAFGPCQLAFAMQGVALSEGYLLAEVDIHAAEDRLSEKEWDEMLELDQEFCLHVELSAYEGDIPILQALLREREWRGHKLEAKFEIVGKDDAYLALGAALRKKLGLPSLEDRAGKRAEKRFQDAGR